MKILDFLQKEGIPFKRLSLYKEAFTHSSYANEASRNIRDYERLEFMGDAVLQLYVSDYIFNKFPSYPEGSLTTLRSKLVREESLLTVLCNGCAIWGPLGFMCLYYVMCYVFL